MMRQDTTGKGWFTMMCVVCCVCCEDLVLVAWRLLVVAVTIQHTGEDATTHLQRVTDPSLRHVLPVDETVGAEQTMHLITAQREEEQSEKGGGESRTSAMDEWSSFTL
jgi:hypothetical protein